MEQPTRSYMMPYLDGEGLLEEHDELILHQCMFGRSYMKPTSFLTFGGLELEGLAKRCVGMSHGRKFHVRLGFGASSSAAAAEYSPGLAAAYAGAVTN